MKRRILLVIVLLILSGLSPSALVLADNPPKFEGKIAFASDRAGTSTYGIYIMDADGSNVKQIASRPGLQNYNPMWSPDGKYLIYSTALDTADTIIMNMDVAGATGYGLGENLLDYYTWLDFSADGQSVVYGINLDSIAVERSKSDRLLFFVQDLADLPSGKSTEIANPTNSIYRVAFLSDGALIMSGYDGLYRTDRDGSNRSLIASNVTSVFALSPDKKRIVASVGKELITMDADGKNRLTIGELPTNSFLYSANWSPDSKMISIIRLDILNPSANATPTTIRPQERHEYHVFTLNADGSNWHQVASEFARPSWSPDSQYITYAVLKDINFYTYRIVITRPDGTVVHEFTTDSSDLSPAWQPSVAE